MKSIVPFLSMVACTFAVPVRKEVLHTKVLILGGGMAGITAARTLANDLNITDFLVVEARHELGGRVQNVMIAKAHYVELGANWVQGLGSNPIWALAKKYKLRNIYSNWTDLQFFNNHGWEGEHGAISKAFERFDGPIFDELYDTAEKNNASGLADIDMRAALRLTGWKGQTPAEQAAEYFEFDWEQAETPDVSSFYHFVQTYKASFVDFGDSDNNFVVNGAQGFKRVISGQADEIDDFDKKVLYNQVVRKIEYSSKGVTVTTSEGFTIHAEYALCTFSAGVLQNTDVVFEPTFPSWKQSAVAQLRMATYTKIFAIFPDVFWNSSQFAIYADPVERGFYSVWQNLDVPGFYPGSKLFFATLTGDQSMRAAKQTDKEIETDFMRVLRSMYGQNIPNPTHFLVPRWTDDPLFRGSYSNWGAGVTVEAFDNVRAPLGGGENSSSTGLKGSKDRLFFAGEHTSRKYFGFLQGAYFSGLAAAHHIADCVHNDCWESAKTVAIVNYIQEPPVDYPLILQGRQRGRRW